MDITATSKMSHLLKKLPGCNLHLGNFLMCDNIRLQRNHYDYVPDPYYEGSEGFELVLDLLEDACDNLLTQLLAHPHSPTAR